MVTEQAGHRGDAGARAGQHRVAVPRVADRILHDVAEAEPAVALQQQHPGPEGGRHAGREQPVTGDQVEAERAERRQGGALRRGPLAVEHEHLRLRGVVADHGDLPAGPVQVGLDHLEHQPGGDGGVERIAARLQHGQPRGRGEPVRGRHHAEGARQLRPGGERRSLGHHAHSLEVTPARGRSGGRSGRPAGDRAGHCRRYRGRPGRSRAQPAGTRCSRNGQGRGPFLTGR